MTLNTCRQFWHFQYFRSAAYLNYNFRLKLAQKRENKINWHQIYFKESREHIALIDRQTKKLMKDVKIIHGDQCQRLVIW